MATVGVKEQRWTKWIGPVISVVAVVGSLGVLAWSIMGRAEPEGEFVRLGPVALGEVGDYLRFSASTIPARADAADAAAAVTEHARQTTRALLDARSIPSRIQYTIARGGTLEDVANNFGIFHHEITALNPGYGLHDPLPAGTRVTVWEAGAETSRSEGRPSNGNLVNAVPMIEGPGRRLRPNRFKLWATMSTVALLDHVLRQWASRYPDMHEILVGNLSLRKGGKVKPHRTHQSGRDVDLSFIQVWDGVTEINWQEMGPSNFDARGNWLLLELLRETDSIAVIFIDYSLQKLLHEYAIETGRYTQEELAVWMQYPDPKTRKGRIIQHAPGHVDHIHARFGCAPNDEKCAEDDH